MKNLLRLSTTALLAVTLSISALTLAGCGKKVAKDGDIDGLFRLSKIKAGKDMKDDIVFKFDGEGKVKYKLGTENYTESTYKVDGDRVIIGDGRHILRADGSNLIFYHDGMFKVTMKRD